VSKEKELEYMQKMIEMKGTEGKVTNEQILQMQDEKKSLKTELKI